MLIFPLREAFLVQHARSWMVSKVQNKPVLRGFRKPLNVSGSESIIALNVLSAI
jgi:hypothetical protein